MISDVLSDAVSEIRVYLARDTPDCNGNRVYRGLVRRKINALVRQMDSLRQHLDTLPIQEGRGHD